MGFQPVAGFFKTLVHGAEENLKLYNFLSCYYNEKEILYSGTNN
jgi:hypothetical protein